MAELIVTDVERAAASYLEWDDASLGRFCKMLALQTEALKDDPEGFRRVTAASCAMLICSTVFQSNAASLELTLTGHTHEGKPTGDWEITVERVAPPAEA